MVEAVLFDYGLVLTGPPDPRAWAEMGRILDIGDADLEQVYWAHRLAYDRGDLSGRAYWAAMKDGLPDADVDALIRQDTILWTTLNQPMVDWALRLRASGRKTGILSNLGDEMMHGVLEALPWMAGFSHKTFSHTLRLTKPALAIYDYAARGLATEPAEILFVDDREDNIAGALAAGMQAIRYGDHDEFLMELRARGLGELWLRVEE